MAEKRYSIDDILNEYPKSSSDGEAAVNVNINDLLKSYEKKSAENVVTLHNTDIFNKVAEPDLNDTENSTKAAAENSGSSFESKYEKLSKAVTKINEQEKNEHTSERPLPKQERSFSEKIEQENNYPEDKKQEEKERISDRLHKSKKSPEINDDDNISEENINPKQENENPFDKYSAIEEDFPNTPEEKEISEPPKESLDDILAEYSDTRSKSKSGKEYTQHRSITEFFTKIVPNDPEAVGGNTELLDGMMRLKKERISRTQHINPIERKSISDIDLNLDDKILPDTSQIPIDKENSELDKLNALKERRSKKIKDFVLVGDEEDEPDSESDFDDGPKVIEDFETLDDAPSIAADIAQLKNSLVMRMLVLIICLIASGYIALANDTGMLPIIDLLNKHTQTNVYLFVNAVIGLLAAFTSYTVISCGLSKLVSLKADCDSLSAVAIVTSIASSMIMFANTNLVKASLVHVYIAAAISSLIFNTIGKLLIVSRTQRSFRFISGSSEKYALFNVSDKDMAQNFTRGSLKDFPELASMRKTEFITEFLKTSYASDSTDKFCRIFTPIVLGAALIVAVLAGISARAEYGASGLYVGISAFVGCICICSAFSMMLVVNMPLFKASRKNHDLHGAILGYDCIDEFADTNSVLIDAIQLFPQGSVSLSAIKVFSDTRIDEAIVEAASLTSQAGSILKNMFYDIIAGKTELLNPVESYIYEDSMGLCGWINNKRVLLGSRELMLNHSIESVPSAAKEQEYTRNGKFAVYLSISGELSAMFIVELTPSMEVKQALSELQKHEIYTIVRSVDSLITINNLSELFDVSPEYFKLLPFRSHPDFSEVTSYQPKQKASLACSGQFASFTSLILSCRNIRGTISAGIAIEAIAMLLGILICLAMVILKSFGELSVTAVILYNLIFAAVLLLFQTFRKN